MRILTLEAGRCIVKDGVPFVTLQGVGDYSPTEADAFAREVVEKLNAYEQVVSERDALRGVRLKMDMANIRAAALATVLEGCIDSQECNGYIGVKLLEEASAALAFAREGK